MVDSKFQKLFKVSLQADHPRSFWFAVGNGEIKVCFI